jgi:hypothetical protein
MKLPSLPQGVSYFTGTTPGANAIKQICSNLMVKFEMLKLMLGPIN